jgi:hypothetical protein
LISLVQKGLRYHHLSLTIDEVSRPPSPNAKKSNLLTLTQRMEDHPASSSLPCSSLGPRVSVQYKRCVSLQYGLAAAICYSRQNPVQPRRLENMAEKTE